MRSGRRSQRIGDVLAGALTGRLLAAVLGGLLLWLAFPDHDLGWLAPVGVAALAAAGFGAGLRSGLLVGLAFGLAFFVPTLSWTGVYVGALPWFALAVLEALYLAAMVGVTVLVQRPLIRRGRVALAHLVVPLAWVLQETARSTTPFGGFPWARLAFSQADTPLVGLAAYGGAPGVTFAVALLGAGLYAVLRGLALRPERLQSLVAGGVAVLVVLGAGLTLGPGRAPTDGAPARVLAVQGNVPRPGLDFNTERRQVLDNHVQATVQARTSWGARPPDVVIWPENASDIDPLRNPDARAAITSAVSAAGAPILVGAVLNEPAPDVSNASLLFRPGASGDPERYVKQHPVPFAEYIPFRSFFRRFSDKVDLVTRDFTSGDRPGGFEIQRRDGRGPFWVVPTICFEVAYDGLMRESVLQPGRATSLLAVQTNNATFGYTAESEQQFAISRLRAIEHGRSVVHISTVGVSAIIAPDGTFAERTQLFTAATLLGDPVVRSQITVSDRIGSAPEVAAAVLLVLLLLLGRGGAARVWPSGEKERDA